MERLESVTRIPVAIEAIFASVNRASAGRGPRDQVVMEELAKVFSQAKTIREAMIEFSQISVDINPWKHAHHCTNQVLLNEMTVLFKMSRSAIADMIRDEPNRISLELEKVHDLESSQSHILAHDPKTLRLDLPVNLSDFLRRHSYEQDATWHSFILFSIEQLQDHFDGRRDELFYKTLKDYRTFVHSLNQASDNRLLSGLGKLSDQLGEMRNSLSMMEP